MSTYRIICVKKATTHSHILSVGTGTDPAKPASTFTVKEVRDMLDNKDVFHTSDGNGHDPLVYKDNCKTKVIVNGKEQDCGVETIRSAADATTVNNLDNLVTCP